MARLRIAAALLVAALTAIAFSGAAQDYPTRPITIVVSFPPGGLSDVAGRTVAQELRARLGQPVVVENRVGGSGIVGANHVAKAPPDGYTLLLNAGADVTNVHFLSLPYDTVKDFSPIGMVAEGPPLVLVVHPSQPYKTVQEFVAGARANPGKLSIGSSGTGASPSIAIAQFKSMANIDVVDVPYRGVSQAVTGVISGEIQASFVFQINAKAPAEDGRVRALAITTPQRSPSWPQLPTMTESGFPGFVYQGFVGLTAPAGTPQGIITLLNKHLNAIVAEPAFRERFAAFGMYPREKNSPADFAAFLREEIENYGERAKLAKR